MIDNPQPTWLPLLLLAVPGIGFAAYGLNKALFPEADRALSTVPAIGIVIALLLTHVLALAFGSLSIGLAVAWSILGVGGYCWVAWDWRGFRSSSSSHANWAQRLGLTALATMPIILPTLLANFSDETNFNGHYAIIAHLQNGIYPPRYLYEPTLPLRYHYGFDIAGVIVTGLLRLRLDQAVDLLSLTLWPCTFLLLWRLGDHVGGRRAGVFVALSVCFAGGWQLLAAHGAPCTLCAINGLKLNPPFVHYYFQHPWSLGVPIFCLVILQRAALPRLDNYPLGLAALVCSLIMLSLAQVVLFVTTVVALGVREAWKFVRSRHRLPVTMLLALAMSLLGAKLIGGFFVSGSFPSAGGIFDTGFSLRRWSEHDAILGQVQWNLASFGILPVLGFIGLLSARRERDLLFILTVLSLIVVNALHYKYSWDIVKFGTVSFITLAIGTGLFLSEIHRVAVTFRRRLTYTVLLVAVAGQGLMYPYLNLYAAYSREGRRPFSMQMMRPYFSSSYSVDSDDAQAVNFLRTHMAPSEIVYCTEVKSEPYAIWGGLPTDAAVYVEKGDHEDVYGLGEKKLAARMDLARVSEDWLDRVAAEHVKWLVTDPDDGAINAILNSEEGRRRAVLAAQFGKVRVFRLE